MTPETIVDAVCRETGLDVDLFWHVRGRRSDSHGPIMAITIKRTRMVAAWLMRVVLRMSLPQIARAIGLSAHSDVHHLLKRLPEEPGLVEMCTDLWFEMERPIEVVPLATLRRKVAEFERAVGLHLSTSH